MQGIAQLVAHLGAYRRYVQQCNDVQSVPSPYEYFISRCIDAFTAASLAFIRHERCRIVNVREVEELCSRSRVIQQASSDSDVMVLAGIIRPCAEMYVDLLTLERAKSSSTSLDDLCRLVLYKHLAGDCEQKLKACVETYGCKPSYFEATAAGYMTFVEHARRKLDATGAAVLAKQSEKQSAAFQKASHSDFIALGGDSFALRAGLAYKLHFLPQKSVLHTPHGVEFHRQWCAILLMLLGEKLAKAADEPVPSLDLSQFSEPDPSEGRPNPNCPNVGEVVFFDWGVAHVESVDLRPLGNEVLSVSYDVPFVQGLRSNDVVPRRFMKCILDRAKYEGVLREQMLAHGATNVTELLGPQHDSDKMRRLYLAFYECRFDAKPPN